MPRVRQQEFGGGLFVNGDRDLMPPGTMRRATGVADNLDQGRVRVVDPAVVLYPSSAGTQYERFNGALHWGQGIDLVRDGVVIDSSQNGQRVFFLKAPPQPDLNDYLFVAGGGALKKVSPGGSVTQWGITPPGDGLLSVVADVPARTIIDSMGDSAATWVAKPATPLSNDAVVYADQTPGVVGSLLVEVKPGTRTQRVQRPVMVNLRTLSVPDDSPQEDYIELWVYFELANDEDGMDALQALDISFSLGDDTFEKNAYTRQVLFTDTVRGDVQGTAEYAAAENTAEADIPGQAGAFAEGRDPASLLATLALAEIPRLEQTWIQVLVPKASFQRGGTDQNLDWQDVEAVRLVLRKTRTTGQVRWRTDGIFLTGGVGMQGTYQYHVTYRNRTTGSRSNPNPTPVKVEHVLRAGTVLSNLPVSADPQVDEVEIWRTVGNGEAFFLCGAVDNGVTTFEDRVADFAGLVTGSYLSIEPNVLGTEEIRFDNARPFDTFKFVCDELFAGRAWWCGCTVDGNSGRVYYSPVGRPESIDGFIEVSNSPEDDPTVGMAVWNDVLYVFTKTRLFRVAGETEPFAVQEVFGAPGTEQADTIVASPFGVFYVARDGVRLYDGTNSGLVAFEAVAPWFEGEAAEGIGPIAATTATWCRDELWVSDGLGCLIFNARRQRWRYVPVLASTLFTDVDERVITGVTATVKLEVPGGSVGMLWEVELPSLRVAPERQTVVQRVLIDMDAGGQTVTPTLVLPTGTRVLPAFAPNGRQVTEFALGEPTPVVGLRLAIIGAVPSVQLFEVAWDLYEAPTS